MGEDSGNHGCLGSQRLGHQTVSPVDTGVAWVRRKAVRARCLGGKSAPSRGRRLRGYMAEPSRERRISCGAWEWREEQGGLGYPAQRRIVAGIKGFCSGAVSVGLDSEGRWCRRSFVRGLRTKDFFSR